MDVNTVVCAGCGRHTATTADDGFRRVPYCRRCFTAHHGVSGPGGGHLCTNGCRCMLLPPPGGGDPLAERCATCDAAAVAALRAAGWHDVLLQNSAHAVVRGQIHPRHRLGSGRRVLTLHLDRTLHPLGADNDYARHHALARLWAMGTSPAIGTDPVTDVRPVVRAENGAGEGGTIVRVFIGC